MKKLLLLSTAVFLLLLFHSCEEDNNAARVDFRIDYQVNGQDFVPGNTYDVNGTAVRFDVANFYLGGFTFTPQNGNTLEVPDKYLLVSPGAGRQEVATIDPGDYAFFQFFIGVDSLTNGQSQTDFSSRPMSDPLAEQIPPMHWSWSTGYKFVRIDGLVDTDGDGTPDSALEYHLGHNERLLPLQIPSNKALTSGDNEVVFTFDLARLFENINIATNNSFHTAPGEESTASVFWSNLSDAFSLQ